MPRDGSGIYQLPAGTRAIPNTTIASTPYNALLDEIVQDANAARPIAAGGTGAATPDTARQNLGAVSLAGDRMTGSLSSKVADHGTKGSVTEEFKYADGNTHKVTVNGALIINPTGLTEGDVMQINILYTSGSISVSGMTQWELGGGEKAAALSDLGITLVSGAAYRIIFEMVATLRTGCFQ